MHIPDGFLDIKTCIGTSVLAAGGLGYALSHARRTLSPRKVPLLGLSAAFVFAAQMINFPVAGGTSGHLLGGVLVGALLGPSCAIIVLATVLIVQCIAFADGGITALGANIFNMGIVGGAGGWMIYAALVRMMPTLRGRLVAAVVAAWISTVVASICAAGELATSGTVAWHIAFPAMAGVHSLIAVGEGLITALVLSTVASVRPELVIPPAAAMGAPVPARSLRPVLIYGLLAALGMGLFVSPFACSWDDGLDRVASAFGFRARERQHAALLPEYKFLPESVSPAVATGIAGGVGTLAVFGLALFFSNALVKSRAKRDA